MFVGVGPQLDPNRLQPIVDYSKHIFDRIEIHRSGCHKVKDLTDDFWADHKDLYDYVEANTYPYDCQITGSWLKYVHESFKIGDNQGGFMGLHQDYMYEHAQTETNDHVKSLKPGEEYIIHTNSIIVNTSDDIQGGELVLAGDSLSIGGPAKRKTDTRDLLYRLKVVDAKDTGALTVWNGLTVHGVAEVRKGWRTTLIVVKRSKFNDDYFKVATEKDNG